MSQKPFNHRQRVTMFCLCIVTLHFNYCLGQSPFILPPSGSANRAQPLGNAGYYQLTDATPLEHGALWRRTPIDLRNRFDYTFWANFGHLDADGADGIAFVIQNMMDPNTATPVGNPIAGFGGSLAFSNLGGGTPIDHSVAIEFDTYFNPRNKGGEEVFDLTNGAWDNDGRFDEIDHIDIFPNGTMWDQSNTVNWGNGVPSGFQNHSTSLIPGGPVQAHPNKINIEDDSCHPIRITWDPVTQILEVYFQDLVNPRVQVHVNLMDYVNNPAFPAGQAWFGFTSATGGVFNRHFINYIEEQELQFTIPCEGGQVLLGTTLPDGPSISYHWTGPGINSSNRIIAAAAVGQYTLTIDDGENCAVNYTFNVTSGDFCHTDYRVCRNEKVEIGPDMGCYPPGTTVSWASSKNLSCLTCPHPIARVLNNTTFTATINIPGQAPQTYQNTVTVTNPATTTPFQTLFNATDQTNNTLNAVCKGVDCDFTACGKSDYGNVPTIVNFGSGGNVNWSRVYSNLYDPNQYIGELYSIVPVKTTTRCLNAQTGYAATGFLTHGNQNDILVLRTDANGAVLNSKIIDIGLRSQKAFNIKQTKDGGFVIVGIDDYPKYDENGVLNIDRLILAKLNADLSINWMYDYQVCGLGKFFQVIETLDGSFLVVLDGKGGGLPNNGDVVALKFDKFGNKKWVKHYWPSQIPTCTPNVSLEPTDVMELVTDAPHYFITGTCYKNSSSTTDDVLYLVLDTNGAVRYASGIDNVFSQEQRGSHILASDNLREIFLTFTTNPYNGDNDPALVSINTGGSAINWQYRYWANPTDETVGNVIRMSDPRNFVFVGTQTQTDGSKHGYAVETDPVGRTGCEIGEKFYTYPLDFTENTLGAIREEVYPSANDPAYDTAGQLSAANACQPPHTSTCSEVTGQSLIYYPNFPLGGSSYFLSDLHLNNYYPTFALQDYTIVTNAAQVKPYWVGTDHTGDGSGIFVSKGTVTGDKRAWYQYRPVIKGNYYLFCIWAKNLCPLCVINPGIQLYLNKQYGGFPITDERELYFEDGWVNISGVFRADSTMNMELDVMTNLPATTGSGADFALDDVNFYDLGTLSSSKPSSIAGQANPGADNLLIYPNPVQRGNNLSLAFSSNEKQKLHARIYTIEGKALDEYTFDVNPGSNTLTIKTGNLAPGQYLIYLAGNSQTKIGRFTIAN